MSARQNHTSRSLTTRLLFFTVLFVLLAEIVVMIPSLANRRLDWFNDRIETAYLVSVALEGPRGRMISEEGAKMLFETAGIRGVTSKRGEVRALILAPEIDPHGSQQIYLVDMNNISPLSLVSSAWATIFSDGESLIQVTARPMETSEDIMDIVVSQMDLRDDLRQYARNILILSLVISSMTAVLLFYVFNRMIVHPVRRLTRSMSTFEADPDSTTHIHVPSERDDEIGLAERSLSMMQQRINELLGERRRLAALGAGISKISHDLRNILASAQLMSDRLAKSDDPAVRKLSPRLISALDRAIALSRDTLSFGGMEARKLNLAPFSIRELVDEVLEDTASTHVAGANNCPEDLTVNADRAQLYRCLFNLARNAVEAMLPDDVSSASANGGKLVIDAKTSDGTVSITIADNGPGLPDHARADLFEPFKGSQKPGGSGLGLAIAAEIARAHGGDLRLLKSDAVGTVFEISLPGSANA